MSILRSEAYRRAARGVLRWAAWYTRGLSPAVAGERLDEIASDLHEHALWAEEAGMTPAQVRRDIHRRRLHGAFDDLLWRHEQKRLRRDPAGAGRLVLGLGAVLGAALLASGGFALARTVDYAVTAGDPLPVILTGLAGSLALALLGLVLLAPRRSRFVGSLLLVAAGPSVVYFGLAGLGWSSALVTHAVAATPGWRVAELGLVGAVAVLFGAAALWWWPSQADAEAAR